MKILKNLLLVIVGLFLLFLALGFIKPEINYGHEFTVDQPAKETWAVAKDESKFDQWLKGFQSIELISGEKDKVGSKYKVVVSPQPGENFEMTQTILSIKEFDHVEMTYDGGMMDFYHKITHTEKDGKTTVKSDSKVTGKGMMMRSMFAVMEIFTNSFQKQETENFEALKKLIESNTTDYYPAPVLDNEEIITEKAAE